MKSKASGANQTVTAADTQIDRLASWLRRGEHVCIMTGAGMSAESGVATFRDAQTGLWSRFRPEELATPRAFAAKPQRVWRWYAWRRAMIAQAKPHAGHYALVELAEKVPRLSLVTQNVDGMHQRAGQPDVIELHGNLTRNRCAVTNQPVETELEGEPPMSPFAPDSYVRPDVVWFGESLPQRAVDQATQALQSCDVLISIGSSALVEPAASMPIIARRHGAKIAEINPVPSALPEPFDLQLALPAGSALPTLVERL